MSNRPQYGYGFLRKCFLFSMLHSGGTFIFFLRMILLMNFSRIKSFTTARNCTILNMLQSIVSTLERSRSEYLEFFWVIKEFWACGTLTKYILFSQYCLLPFRLISISRTDLMITRGSFVFWSVVDEKVHFRNYNALSEGLCELLYLYRVRWMNRIKFTFCWKEYAGCIEILLSAVHRLRSDRPFLIFLNTHCLGYPSSSLCWISFMIQIRTGRNHNLFGVISHWFLGFTKGWWPYQRIISDDKVLVLSTIN